MNKVELNKVTHSVRAAQSILQYGVGAMVNFRDQTLTTAAPEFWGKTINIYDERFAKALGVDYFAQPALLAYSRFPEWYFCPKCRRFQPLKKWIKEYIEEYRKTKTNLHDQNKPTHYRCIKCQQDLIVTNIVTVCEKGHLNDFPWIEWVHKEEKKGICNKPELLFKTSPLTISCSCGAKTTLIDAFDNDCFQKLNEKFKKNQFRCDGNHPFRHKREECDCYPRTVQRGSSSVYFPMVYSSVVIPPYADKLNAKIEQSKAYNECISIIRHIISHEGPEGKIATITRDLPEWVDKITNEIGASASDVEKILCRKWQSPAANNTEIENIQYRIEEYDALSGEISSSNENSGDFCREEIDISKYKLSHIKSISLINKVRVVKALVGFSRLHPVDTCKASGFVSIKEYMTNWYPAYEVRGEGIFIEFKQDEIADWIKSNPAIKERAECLQENYKNSFIGKYHSRNITPKFLMLHTLSHLLISQLSFECGYNVASLSERIYSSEKSDGKEMAGIFIYTANGDSEGTLGGLVRQGRPDAFPRIFRKAIERAKVCSNDPICIMSNGQGRDSLNLAACYACGLLPETCCEERNSFLDRGIIIGTYENPEIGFWSDILA